MKLHPNLHLLMIAAGGPMACGGSKPCSGVIQGANYDVVVQGERSPSASSGCEENWGFGSGTQFSAAINELRGDDCLVGIPTLSCVTGWTFQESNTMAPAGGFLIGTYDAHFGGCGALLHLDVSSDAKFQCFHGSQTTTDDCLLSLHFEPHSGPCPSMCTTEMIATFTRK
jgi:hypothetical protein